MQEQNRFNNIKTLGDFYDLLKIASNEEIEQYKITLFEALSNTIEKKLYGLAMNGVYELYALDQELYNRKQTTV